ncbi:MAG: hypothetical protein R3B06_18100 [Kofleriaceae bacterium]
MTRTLIAAAALLGLAACPKVQPPIDPKLEVPADGAQTCASVCQQMGLSLTSVVVVSSRLGCVCSPAETSPGAPGASAATTSGAGAVVLAVAAVDDEAAAAAARQRAAASTRAR